eukprot:2395788-Pleurochrysis_carterae.AAC.1
MTPPTCTSARDGHTKVVPTMSEKRTWKSNTSSSSEASTPHERTKKEAADSGSKKKAVAKPVQENEATSGKARRGGNDTSCGVAQETAK